MKDRGFNPDNKLGEGIASMGRQELCALVSGLCDQIRADVGPGSYRGGLYPENISLHEDGSVAIGPGKLEDWEGQELQFIAPELYWGGKLGPAADVYSLGMLLYYGVSGGKLPFDGDTEARMEGKGTPIPEEAGRQLGPIIAKATAFKAAARYQSVGELQAMVDSCLRNRYVDKDSSAQALFHKDKEELSDLERIMVGILAAEDAGMDGAQTCEMQEPSEAEKDAPENAQQTEPEQDAPAEESAAGAEGETEAAGEAASEAGEAPAEPALSEEEEEMERIRALFNAPYEEPPFENEAVAKLPEEQEGETLEPVPLAMSGEGEDVRVYQPTPHSRRDKEGAAPIRQPIPILTVDENPELAPVVPLTTVNGRPVSRQEQFQQELQRRRRRPVAAVLILCSLLILSAIVLNAMLQGGVSLRGSRPSDASGDEDASGVVSVPTARPSQSEGDDTGDVPFDYGSLITESDTGGAGIAPKAHSYEVLASDMSWTEARDACREKGGYLAVISNEEEFNTIVQLVIDSGLSRVWVGCHRIDDNLVWETTDEVTYYPWDYNEPSYYDGYDGTQEDYLLLWHNMRWVYNDSRNDPVADYPELYSGSLGYVIEYDE